MRSVGQTGAQEICYDGGPIVDLKVSRRPIEAKKQKIPTAITVNVKKSTQAMSALVNEVSKAMQLIGYILRGPRVYLTEWRRSNFCKLYLQDLRSISRCWRTT